MELELASNALKEQVVEALRTVALDMHDIRHAAASFELCVCYASEFGLYKDGDIDEERSRRKDLEYLAAAKEGDEWARLALVPVFGAFGTEIPAHMPVLDWLEEAVGRGSAMALDQMRHLHKDRYDSARGLFREYCGNEIAKVDHHVVYSLESFGHEHILARLNPHGDTIVHFAAATGDVGLLEDLLRRSPEKSPALNCQNDSGNTPLLQAARARQARVVNFLARTGADGSILNMNKESMLHFFTRFEDEAVWEVAQDLALTGAHSHLQTASQTSSGENRWSVIPSSAGLPADHAPLSGGFYIANSISLSGLISLLHAALSW